MQTSATRAALLESNHFPYSSRISPKRVIQLTNPRFARTGGNVADLVAYTVGRSSGMLLGPGTSDGGASICSLASKNATSLLKLSITPGPPVKLDTARQQEQSAPLNTPCSFWEISARL